WLANPPGKEESSSKRIGTIQSGDDDGGGSFGIDDLAFWDPEFHRHLTWLLDNDIGDGGELGLTFEVDVVKEGRVVAKALVEGGEGVGVTETNKGRFVELAVGERFERSRRKREAFLEGFWEVCPPTEFEILIAGETTVSIPLWKSLTVYEGMSLAHQRVVDWFWEVHERMALLRFATGVRDTAFNGGG
ncbi:hypothetical protein BC829DRAFT_398272, partial [Chytridium lagenaria]